MNLQNDKIKLYLTIGIITLIIFIAWLLNFKNIIQTNNNQDSELEQNWQQLTNNFNNVLNDYQEIKNSLSQSPTSTTEDLQNTAKLSPDELDKLANQLKLETTTANWQTYTNQEYSFEFKYPSTWGDSWETKNMNDATCFYVAEYDNRQGEVFCIKYMSITEWDKNNYQDNNELNVIGRNNDYIFYIPVSLEAHTYTVTPNPYDVNSQILSTFKFTEPQFPNN